MDARRSPDQELRGLLGGIGDADLELGFGVTLGGHERGLQLRRNRGIAEIADPLGLSVGGDRDHAGDDRHLDPTLAGCRDEVEVDLVVEEELGDQEGSARLDLGRQKGEIGIQIGRLGMHLGKTGATDRKVVVGADEADQLGGAAEPAVGLDEVALSARRIATQGEDVLDAGRGNAVQSLPDPLPGLTDAAQMRHHLETQIILQRLGDFDRTVPSRAARSIGDGDEVKPEIPKHPRGLHELALGLFRLRWEELDRESGLGSGQQIVDAHGPIVSSGAAARPQVGRTYHCAMPDQQLTRAQARRIALAAQGLDRPRPETAVTMRQVQRVIDRLGLIQIDSVNVLARAHLMPFFSRLGSYDTGLIERATGRAPRRLVEYWAHEASLMPPATRRLLGWRMERAAKEAWRPVRAIAAEQPELVEAVYEEVMLRGPITAAELERALRHDLPHMTDNWGWNWSQVKAALEFLFWAGRISSAGRTAQFERRYDLPDRVLPPSVRGLAMPTAPEAIRELVRIAARSHGIGTERCLRDYFRLGAREAGQAIAELLEEGELIPVEVVEEGGRQPSTQAYLHRDARIPRRASGRALLSPFDPLVWERRRIEWLFDFHYRIEIYTPAAKRVYGYYVLPFLLGDRLVARLDLKADRERGRLLVKAAHSEPACSPGTAVELASELALLAEWVGLEEIEVEDRGDFAPDLRKAGL